MRPHQSQRHSSGEGSESNGSDIASNETDPTSTSDRASTEHDNCEANSDEEWHTFIYEDSENKSKEIENSIADLVSSNLKSNGDLLIKFENCFDEKTAGAIEELLNSVGLKLKKFDLNYASGDFYITIPDGDHETAAAIVRVRLGAMSTMLGGNDIHGSGEFALFFIVTLSVLVSLNHPDSLWATLPLFISSQLFDRLSLGPEYPKERTKQADAAVVSWRYIFVDWFRGFVAIPDHPIEVSNTQSNISVQGDMRLWVFATAFLTSCTTSLNIFLTHGNIAIEHRDTTSDAFKAVFDRIRTRWNEVRTFVEGMPLNHTRRQWEGRRRSRPEVVSEMNALLPAFLVKFWYEWRKFEDALELLREPEDFQEVRQWRRRLMLKYQPSWLRPPADSARLLISNDLIRLSEFRAANIQQLRAWKMEMNDLLEMLADVHGWVLGLSPLEMYLFDGNTSALVTFMRETPLDELLPFRSVARTVAQRTAINEPFTAHLRQMSDHFARDISNAFNDMTVSAYRRVLDFFPSETRKVDNDIVTPSAPLIVPISGTLSKYYVSTMEIPGETEHGTEIVGPNGRMVRYHRQEIRNGYILRGPIFERWTVDRMRKDAAFFIKGPLSVGDSIGRSRTSDSVPSGDGFD